VRAGSSGLAACETETEEKEKKKEKNENDVLKGGRGNKLNQKASGEESGRAVGAGGVK
jgi:hypothetical protein